MNKISIEKLEKLEDAMSFILIIDKCREPKDLENMKDLKGGFWEKIKETLKNKNIPETEAESIEKMMERVNVAEKDIDDMVNMLENGMSIDVVEKITGLSKTRAKEILKEIKNN